MSGGMSGAGRRFRAVLFDLGGVILAGPFEAFALFEREHGLPDGFLRRVNAANPDTNAWARFERAEIDLLTFRDLFAAEARTLGHDVDAFALLAVLQGEVRSEMVDAVRACRLHGYATGCLTNVVPPALLDPGGDPRGDTGLDGVAGMGTAAGRRALLTLFDVVVESARVGMRKPEPEFYRFACDRLGISPDQAVFLDDLGVNLKPARAMGMATIKVTDPGAAIAELEALLGVSLSSPAPAP